MFSLRKMWDPGAQVVVDAPPDKVFSYVTDFARQHEWLPEYAGPEKASEGPVGVGSTFKTMERHGPFSVQADIVVTEYAPNERLAFEHSALGYCFSISIHLEPEPVSGGTRVTVRREEVPQWWLWPVFVLLLPLALPLAPLARYRTRRWVVAAVEAWRLD